MSAACGGGGHDRPKSETNLYGYQVEQLMQAVPILQVEGGTLAVRARGGQTSFYVPGITMPDYDPITGRTTFSQVSESYSVRAWYVALSAITPEEQEISTGWMARTLWIVSAVQVISSRDVKASDDGVFGAVFLNPPFASDGTWAVAEMVRGSEVQLVGAQIVWTLNDRTASQAED